MNSYVKVDHEKSLVLSLRKMYADLPIMIAHPLFDKSAFIIISHYNIRTTIGGERITYLFIYLSALVNLGKHDPSGMSRMSLLYSS